MLEEYEKLEKIGEGTKVFIVMLNFVWFVGSCVFPGYAMPCITKQQ